MKAILVVDINMTQDNKHICEDDKKRCPLWNSDIKFCMYGFNNNTKGCPLKSMPKKMAVEERWYSKDFARGYNLCVDEILGAEDYEIL